MRVSDAERQRAIDELRRHCGAGRIDMDEYSSRLERALAATTLADLDALLADLPIVRIDDPAGMRASAGSSSSAGSGVVARAGRMGSDSSDDGSYAAQGRALSKRLGTTAVVVLTVVMVLAAVVLALAASWVWAAVLLVGWFIGVLQGWLGGLRGGGR
jgi:cobalamin biosynthesis Mg chelatase CobN